MSYILTIPKVNVCRHTLTGWVVMFIALPRLLQDI